MKIKDEEFYKTIDSFLNTYLIKQKNFSPKTKNSYKKSLNLLLEFFKDEKGMKNYQIGFEDLTYENIAAFSNWLSDKKGSAPQTVNNRLMAIRSFAKYAAILDPSKVNTQIQIKNVPTKKVKKTVVGFLEENALEVLFQQPDINSPIGLRDYCFMTLMYETAARCAELVNLKIQDMDLDSKSPIVYLTGKGNKSRRIPIGPETAANMRKYLRTNFSQEKSTDTCVFFTTWKGSNHRISPDAVALFMKKYAAQAHTICAGVPVNMHPHLLRHSRAMHLYRGGMALPLLSEFLGHSSVDTTRIYAWADTEMKRNAIKQVGKNHVSEVKPVWIDDEDMIRKLYGLD